jgi:hypothetical protein
MKKYMNTKKSGMIIFKDWKIAKRCPDLSAKREERCGMTEKAIEEPD